MGNHPEYIGIWLGLSKAGFVTALINTNLRKDVLIHSINAAECKAIIFGAEFNDGNSIIFNIFRCNKISFVFTNFLLP